MNPMEAVHRIKFATDVFEELEISVRVEIELVGRHTRVYLYRVHLRFEFFSIEVFVDLAGRHRGPLHFSFHEEECHLDQRVGERTLQEHAAEVLGLAREHLHGELGAELHARVEVHLLELDQACIDRSGWPDQSAAERREELLVTARDLTNALDAQNRATRRKYEDLLHLLEQIWTTFSRFEEDGEWLGRDAVDSLAGALQEARAQLAEPEQSTIPRTILELAGQSAEERVEEPDSADERIANSLAAAHANAVSVQQRVDETCLRVADVSVTEFERALKAKVSRLVARAFNPLA